MATPTDSITTFSGRRCTRTRVRTSDPSPPAVADTTTSSEVQETSTASLEIAAAAAAAAAVSSQDISPPAITAAPPAATTSIDPADDQSLSSSLAQAQPVIDPSTIDNPTTSITQVFPTIIPAISVVSTGTDQPDPTAAGLISPVRGGAGSMSTAHGTTGLPKASDGGSQSVAGAVGGAIGGAMGIFFLLGLVILCIRRRKMDRWSFSAWRQSTQEKIETDDDDDDVVRESFATRVKDWALDMKERAEDAIAVLSSRLRPKGEDDDDDRGKISPRDISSPTQANALAPRPSTSASQRSRSISAPPEGIRDQIVSSLKDWKQRFGRGRKDPPTIGRPSSPFAPQISSPTGMRRLSNPFLDGNDRRATLKQGLSDQQRPPITPIRQTIVNKPSRNPFADPSGIPNSTPDFLRRKPTNAQLRGHARKDSDPLRSNPTNWAQAGPGRNPSVRRNSLTNSSAANYFLGTDANPFADPPPPLPSSSRDGAAIKQPPAAQVRDSSSSGSILLQMNRDSDNSGYSDISTIAPLNPSNTKSSSAAAPAAFAATTITTITSNNNNNTHTSAAALALRNSTASNNTDSLFGEPGPSRPTTGLYTPHTPFTPVSRAFRGKSDPFDLDRPEVLGFGNVSGRKEVRASVTRMNSKHKRRSSTPGWGMPGEMGGGYGSGYGGMRDSRSQTSHESKNFSMPHRPSVASGQQQQQGMAGGRGPAGQR